MDVIALADLLLETAEHHDLHEKPISGAVRKTQPKHNLWDWYGPYISARQHGSTLASEVAATAWRHFEMLFPDDFEHLAALSEFICRWVSQRWRKGLAAGRPVCAS